MVVTVRMVDNLGNPVIRDKGAVSKDDPRNPWNEHVAELRRERGKEGK